MSEGLLNIIKGIAYEEYIKNKIVNQNNQVWLWKECPVNYLIQSNLINSHNEHRLYRKSVKNNEEHSLIDTGIDIIKLKDNEFTMIQCKNYKNSVTIGDLAGLWFMACNYPQHFYEVFYTSKLSSNLTLHNVNQRISYIKQDIQFDEIEYILSNVPEKKYLVDEYFKKCKEEKIKLKKKVFVIDNNNTIESRKYQLDAVNSLKDVFIKSTRAILSLPCGLGKTYIAYQVAQDYDVVILFSPLMQHTKQNLDRFILYNSELKCQLVDSDNLGTRDVDKLKSFINNNGKKFLFSTYKSADVIFELYDNYKNRNTLIIIDEFHNLSLKNMTDEEDYIYKLLNTDVKVMSMSATPRVYELENDEFDTTELLGEITYTMSFTDAIKNKLVCDYQIYLPLIVEDVKENHDNIKKELNIGDVNLTVLDKCSFMCCSISDLGFRHMICYFQDIKEIDEFIKTLKIANEFYALDNLIVDKITCETKQTERELILNNFKNHDGVSILCSVKILDECIDIKECDSIFVTYPCKNKVKMVQRLNRCTRINKAKPNKKGGLLLWCDENEDITYTMSSLKEYDPDLVTKVNVRNKDSNIIRKDNKKVMDIQVNQTTKYIVGIKVFNAMKWGEWKNLLFEFVEKNGRVPEKREKYKDKNLGSWLQQTKKKLKDKNDEIYVKLSTDEHVKKSLENYLIKRELNKDKDKLTWDECKLLLFEFCDIYKRTPTQKDIYKKKLVGSWLDYYKRKITDKNDEKYIKLSQNEYVKNAIHDYIIFRDNKKDDDDERLKYDEWKKILFEFCNLNKRVPTKSEKYKNKKIGIWFLNIKNKIKTKNDERYIDLSLNEYIKKSIDNCFINRHNNKDKETIDINEWTKLLFEFCNINKRTPFQKEKFKNLNVGLFFSKIKKKLKDKEDNIYKKYSVDSYIKISFDNCLEHRAKHKNDERLCFEEWKKLLFEFCEIYNRTPTRHEKYKDKNIGIWLEHQIHSNEDKKGVLYEILAKNKYIKQKFDETLARKGKNKEKLSFEDWKKKLFEYSDINKKMPVNSSEHNGVCVGGWLARQYKNINSKEDELYKELSTNMYVKIYLDKYLKNKDKKNKN
jgi:superfamily II DNA or RNA helicase